MTSSIVVLASIIALSQPSGNDLVIASVDSIRADYTFQADLTGDGVFEKLSVTTSGEKGKEWDDLLIRFEIRSDSDSLLFADEWPSEYWCNGYAFYETREVSVEEWVRDEMRHRVDPEHFMPTGEFGSRNASILNNRKEVGYGIRADQYEQLWRAKYDIPIHEHLCQQTHQKGNEIREEFREQISDETIEQLVDEVAGGSGYLYSPSYDGMYIVAWIKSEKRFAIVIYGG